jgi:ABC-2 type transport system ATP-binding protein
MGTTVVITTHFMDEAEELCDRVAIMDEGKIISIGIPDTLVRDLLKSGFKNNRIKREATLEDVFIKLTGKEIRE